MDVEANTAALLLLGVALLGVVVGSCIRRGRRSRGEVAAVWEQQLAALESEAGELRRSGRRREQELTALQGSVERLRAERDDRVDRAHVASLEAHLADTEVQVLELTAQLRAVVAERDELRGTRNADEVRVASLRRHVERLEARLEQDGGDEAAAVPGSRDGPHVDPITLFAADVLSHDDDRDGVDGDDVGDDVIDLRRVTTS